MSHAIQEELSYPSVVPRCPVVVGFCECLSVCVCVACSIWREKVCVCSQTGSCERSWTVQ